jgi:voltage-gated sodium channel
MVEVCRRIANAYWFSRFITLVILLAAVLVGAETYPSVVARHGNTLHVIDLVIIWIFAGEVVVKMVAEAPTPWRYFKDPWNIFDFAIVAVVFLPLDTQFVMVLRLVRVLRVLKLVRALPKLQILVSAMLKSIPSMGYVSLLLLMLFYLFAVTATFLFSGNDPVHFENLQISMLSLFRVVTLEDWTDVMYIQMYGCDNYGYEGIEDRCTQPLAYPIFGAVFFCSFVLIGTMIVLNLFVGVIMNGMDEAQKEQQLADKLREPPDTLHAELGGLLEQLATLQDRVEKMQAQARSRES